MKKKKDEKKKYVCPECGGNELLAVFEEPVYYKYSTIIKNGVIQLNDYEDDTSTDHDLKYSKFFAFNCNNCGKGISIEDMENMGFDVDEFED